MPGAVLALKEWDGYPLDEDCLHCACGAVYGVGVASIKLIHMGRASLLWVAPLPRQRESGKFEMNTSK